MRKKSNRRVRVASEPALVRTFVVKDVEIGQRLAIEAMRGGWADYENSYRTLADCHSVLMLGLRKKRDSSMDGIIKGGYVALLNIFERFKSVGKVGATGTELTMLEIMLDSANDFWKRQSSALLEECIYANALIRKRQLEDAKRKAA